MRHGHFPKRFLANRAEHRSHSSHRSHRDPANVLGSNSNGGSANKKARLDVKGSNGSLGLPATGGGDSAHLDHTSSEHVVAVTQLKEQMVNLQRQLAKKDKDLLEKDKKVSKKFLIGLLILIYCYRHADCRIKREQG